MVGVFAFVNLPLHRKLQKFSSGTGSPGWSRKKGPLNSSGVVVVDMMPKWLLLRIFLGHKYVVIGGVAPFTMALQCQCQFMQHNNYYYHFTAIIQDNLH